MVYSSFVPKKSRHTYEEDLRNTYFFLMIYGLSELYSDRPQRLRPSLRICAGTSVPTTAFRIVHVLNHRREMIGRQTNTVEHKIAEHTAADDFARISSDWFSKVSYMKCELTTFLELLP